MKIYSENESYKLYKGDMRNMLDVIKKESIDVVLTDPPYELNFMGKGWDNSGIAFQPDTWEKCYEALKPGGYLLAFGGSRTFHRIACAIEDAGFEIRDTIMWLYGSGFPKSMNISKSLDKRNGRNYNEDFRKYINEKRIEKNISLKEINELFGLSTDGGGVASYIFSERQQNGLPTKEQYLILKDKLELDDRFDNLIFIEEAERKVIGQRKSTAMDGYKWLGEKYEESQNNLIDITAPSTDLAKQWQGWGTALKPSFEPIIIARKPFKGTLVDNVIENGVGGINIDECRVEYEKTTNPATNPLYRQQNADKYKQVQGGELSNGAVSWTSGKNGVSGMGRFPANTILTYDETDFDEVCGGFPNTKDYGGETKTTPKNDIRFNASKEVRITRYKESGSASRYFYCAKASKKDRDEGLDTFEERIECDRNAECYSGDVTFNRSANARKNIHPTVKPTELMQYLVRLVTPNNGTVLDPFNGSGSTGKAVMYENKERNKNYKYIGIELTEEYLSIAKARIEYVCNLQKKMELETTYSIQQIHFDIKGEENE